MKLPQISHIHKNNNFFKYTGDWNFLDQPLLPYKFHGNDMWGMYVFIFASCELIKTTNVMILTNSNSICSWETKPALVNAF